MAITDVRDLGTFSATGDGSAVHVWDLEYPLTVTFDSMGTQTLQIQGSDDGMTFTQIGSDVTGDGQVSVTARYNYLRIHCSSHSSGSGHVVVAAPYARDGRNSVAPQLSTAAPENVADSAAVGSSAFASPADHVHAHGNQTDGAHHAAVTTSVNGFMSSTDKTAFNTLINTSEVKTGAGAATPGKRTTFCVASGVGDVLTLADGTVDGQRKSFTGKSGYSSSHTTVITPAHFQDGTTVTLASKFDGCELEWVTALTKWEVVALFGGAVVA
jgi:hypothetical protein